jgi:FdhE protein
MSTIEEAPTASRLHETIEGLEALIGQPAIAEDYVRLRIDLVKAQAAVSDALAERELSPVVCGSGSQQDGPALGEDAIAWDDAFLAALFCALCAAANEYGQPSEGLVNLEAAVEQDATLPWRIAAASVLDGDGEWLASAAEQFATPRDVLLFVGRTIAQPFVADAASRLREQGEAQTHAPDSSGVCPTCGSQPALARLRQDDGKRILCCLLCDEKWEFARLTCPFCGNDDQDRLGTLSIDGVDAHWIEVCESCRHYIKTMDERNVARTEGGLPLVDDVATLHLDLLAERDGYARALL